MNVYKNIVNQDKINSLSVKPMEPEDKVKISKMCLVLGISKNTKKGDVQENFKGMNKANNTKTRCEFEHNSIS